VDEFPRKQHQLPLECGGLPPLLQRCPQLLSLNGSSIHLAQHDVEGPDNGDDVGDQMAANHFVEGLQIDEGRRADAHAIRLLGAIADDVVAENALGRFNRVIDFARGRFDDLADFAEDWPFGNIFDGLEADEPGLAHLFHADHVTVVGVAVGACRDLELIAVVGGVGLGFAKVPFHPAGAEDRTRCAEGDAIGGAEHADIARAADPDAVAGEQVNVFLNMALEILAEAFDVFFEAVIGLVLQTANAKGMRGETGATILFEDFENFFALAETVEERSERANIQSMSAEPNQVAGNALEFGENGANYFCASWSFGIEQFFDCFTVAEAVADCGDIVHAIDIGRKLLIGPILGDFFDAAMEIADHALGAADALAIEFEFDAQYAVGGGMLRAHVEDELVGAEERVVGMGCVVVHCICHVSYGY
jgi:hypothetical protein